MMTEDCWAIGQLPKGVGKSGVTRYSGQDIEEDDDGNWVEYTDYAALESLLLDARAALVVASNIANEFLCRAELAEADAQRYDYLRKHANRISAGPYKAGFEWEWDEPHHGVPDRSLDTAIDAAIVAVGSNSEGA